MWHHNVDLLAYHDLGGRPGFKLALQIYDISDPHDPHITGYYIPDDPKQRRGPIPSKLVHQAQDVLVDRRGVIYMSEGNSGIYILTHNASQ